MILKKKIEDTGLKIEVVENFIQPNIFNKKKKIEFLIFNLNNTQYELSFVTVDKYNHDYVLSRNWDILIINDDFQKVVSFLENTVKSAKA